MNRISTRLAGRKLLKQRSLTLINLIGLSVSLAACIVIFVYVSYEWSFDRHIPGYERTYRILTRLGDGNYWARSFACYPDALAGRPEIEAMTSFVQTSNNTVRVGMTEFNVADAVIADTVFPGFFGIECITGRKEDLGLPNMVFLTPDLAQRLFPSGEVYGQEVFLNRIEGNMNDSLGYFTVAGIVEPIAENSHFDFQMIFSQEGNFREFINDLKSSKTYSSNVYLRLFDQSQVEGLEADLTDVLVPFLSHSFGPGVDAFNSRLQPVRDIHFTTDLNREPKPIIPRSLLYLLLSIGGLILILMCMNFLSTVIVQALKQTRETGIMRILGADALDLFTLSLVKIIFFTGSGLILSWFIIFLASPWFEHIIGSGWDPRESVLKILICSFVAGCFVVILVTTGIHLSGTIRPVMIMLKGELSSGRKISGILGGLTVLQFGIVFFLIAFSLMIGRQLRYTENKDLGYTSENIYIVRIPQAQPNGSVLIEEIRKQPGVISASTAHHHPADIYQHLDFTTGQLRYPFEFRMADRDVFETLDIELLRRFSPEGKEMEGWVINESFYRQLLMDFTEEDIAMSNFEITEDQAAEGRTGFLIAGVMKDFHYASLHDHIGSFAFAIRNPESLYNRWLMVRFREGQFRECSQAVGEMMETFFPGQSNEGFLLEEMLATSYASSQKLSEIIKAFMLLSILISGFGLYGLSLFILQQRTKEIGIRKVFGASALQVNTLLNMRFLKRVLISYIIAIPPTLWAINRWLIDFAYKASLSPWIFIFTAILIAVLVIISVIWQTSSASRKNPVDVIRYE